MNDRETTVYRKTQLASAGIIMLALMSAAFGITEWRLPHDIELLNSCWIFLWAGMIAFVLFKCFATVRVTDRAVKLSVGISYRREIGLGEIASIEIVHLSPLGSRVDRVRGAVGARESLRTLQVGQ